MGRVIIGMDPHKRSATIEIINDREQTLTQGRFSTDTDGYQAMLRLGRQHKNRIWAVEGCNGIGRTCRPASGRRRRNRGGRAIEAVGAGAGVRHRPGPQDRSGRRTLGGSGRVTHQPSTPGCRG